MVYELAGCVNQFELNGDACSNLCGCRHVAKVADNSDGTQAPQYIVGHIDLPPFQSLARTRHVLMVIVVPAFAEGNESEQEIVAAIILGLESPRAPQMGQGIDRERAVPQEDGRKHESPHEHSEAADGEHGRAE